MVRGKPEPEATRGPYFASAHRVLAAQLPSDRVFTAAGGHDWGTWRRL